MRVHASLFLFALGVAAQSDFTCSSSKPCRIGCCSNTGVCGLGPDFCAADKCMSSCNYKSECDPGWGSQWSNATDCPLNVCCSKFGFCGTTKDFCGDKEVKRPSCDGDRASHLTIGYYEGWAMGRACDGLAPEDIPYGAYTHLNFAFAFIDPKTFTIAPMSSGDVDLYGRLTALKRRNPILKIYISVGGWSMNDPDQPTKSTFSDLAASSDAQSKFFGSLTHFMAQYGFDGVDWDWEYPVASERSGKKDDYNNFVSFLQNLRKALNGANKNYGLTITIPSSYWYLQHFDIVKMAKTIDWFNLMSYDLHGTWDSTNPYIGPVIGAHTNLTEIEQSLDLLWRNNIDPAQVVLGLGFYGRSFTLTDPSCNRPGCPFSAGGKPGPCTASAGTLSYSEIQRVIDGGAKPVLDKAAAVKSLTWNNDQWVSYDDEETMRMKLDYANGKCLGGTMVWAASTDNPKGDSAAALNAVQKAVVGYDNIGSALMLGGCGWTLCRGSCKSLMFSVITSTGQKGGFLGDLLSLFGDVVSVAVSAAAAVFTLAATRNPGYAFGALVASYGITNLGLSAGLDAITDTCTDGAKKQYCCPPQDPPICHWDGTAPFCNSRCSGSDFTAAKDNSGDGHRCWTGEKALCCHYDDTSTGTDDDNNACAITDGAWDISTTPEQDGDLLDFEEIDGGNDDCAAAPSKREVEQNSTALDVDFVPWLHDPSYSHLNFFEKRSSSRTYTYCDRTRRRRVQLRSRRYPNVATLNSRGVRFVGPANSRSCPLTRLQSVTNRPTGNTFVVEHVLELNTIAREIQGLIDGTRPGGTLTTGQADFATFFDTAGLLNTPWSQLGFPSRAGTPADSLLELLGTDTNNANLLILERRLNGLKYVLWAYRTVISNSNWNRQNHLQRIQSLNNIVLVFDYLNSGDGTAALRSAYNGARDIWTDFATAGRNQGATYDFASAHRQWFQGHFSEMVRNAAAFMRDNIASELTYWRSSDAATRYGRRQAANRVRDLNNLNGLIGSRVAVTFAGSI